MSIALEREAPASMAEAGKPEQPARLPRTATERRLEKIHAKPMGELLAEAMMAHGSVRAAARSLDIHEGTMSEYLQRWQVRVEVKATAPPV